MLLAKNSKIGGELAAAPGIVRDEGRALRSPREHDYMYGGRGGVGVIQK